MIGIYAGSFDPITNGHIDIIKKASKICSELHVVVARNYSKKHMFSIEERTRIVKKAIPIRSNIKIVPYEGIISEYANQINANLMIRGIRNHIDLQYEQNIEQFTKKVSPNVNTIYFTAEPEHMFTSSSLIREFINAKHIDKIEGFLPYYVFEEIQSILNEREK